MFITKFLIPALILMPYTYTVAAQTTDGSKTSKPVIAVTDSTKVDVEAQFPGGERMWNKYVQPRFFS